MKNLLTTTKWRALQAVIIIVMALGSSTTFAGDVDKNGSSKLSKIEEAEYQALELENELLLSEYFNESDEQEPMDTLHVYEFYTENNELMYKAALNLNDLQEDTQLQSMIKDSDLIMDFNNTSYFVYNQ